MSVNSEKFITYVNLTFTPTLTDTDVYGISHLQHNPLAKSESEKAENFILHPLAYAMKELALGNLFIEKDGNTLYANDGCFAKDGAVFIDNLYNITNCIPACSLAVSCAVLNDSDCREAFALLVKNNNKRKALFLLHQRVVRWIESSGFMAKEARPTDKEINHNIAYSYTLLLNLIGEVDCSQAEKLINDYCTTNNVASVSEHFSSVFTEENRFNVSENYVLDTKYYSVCNAFVSSARALLLYGPAGTGKSVTAKLICREVGIPVAAVINCTSNTDEFLLGKYVMQGDSPRFCESAVTRAIRNGGAVIFEEINFAKPQYLAFLNSLLDDNGFVLLDNNEYVKRHENFRFIATMNDGYVGTKQMNEALLNRMDLMVEVPEMPNDMIKQVLLDEAPECKKYLDRIMDVYSRIRALVISGESDCAISVRNLLAWVRLAKYEDYRTAAEKTIVGSAVNSPETRDAYRSILDIYMW